MTAAPYAGELAGPAPTAPGERISSIDAVRGFALLGILLLNICGFGLPFMAYMDPTLVGEAQDANRWTWAVNQVLADGKMRGLFSMLFGAGVIILTARAAERGLAADIADIYYRRMLWLLLFGFLHAYLIWSGDILVFYALAGLMLYPFRKLRPRALVIGGVCALLVVALLNAGAAFGIGQLRTAAAGFQAQADAGTTLTYEQKQAVEQWQKLQAFFRPDAESLQREIDAARGGFGSVLGLRAGQTRFMHMKYLYGEGIFDVLGMMLLGMALMKLGFFSAALSRAAYVKIAAVGYLVGLPASALAASWIWQGNFDVVALHQGWALHGLARVPVALAHASVLLLICQAGALRWLTSRLAAVGQMAFTNYLMTSIICTTIFYGYGFGLFARLERYELYYVVAGVWLFQLVTSKVWLTYFRFGPFEWVWRSLTYWQRQPMRQPAPAPPPVAAAV
ncbi:MAG TPA: DUF418 domain-containing protein [Vicinamibacterales bacterium]|nr:DUF418 domain-containing protein [Vicinamibacterales bacterium]